MLAQNDDGASALLETALAEGGADFDSSFSADILHIEKKTTPAAEDEQEAEGEASTPNSASMRSSARIAAAVSAGGKRKRSSSPKRDREKSKGPVCVKGGCNNRAKYGNILKNNKCRRYYCHLHKKPQNIDIDGVEKQRRAKSQSRTQKSRLRIRHKSGISPDKAHFKECYYPGCSVKGPAFGSAKNGVRVSCAKHKKNSYINLTAVKRRRTALEAPKPKLKVGPPFSSTLPAVPAVGQTVVGKYYITNGGRKEEAWFRGTISRIEKNGSACIEYVDGTVSTVPAEGIFRRSILVLPGSREDEDPFSDTSTLTKSMPSSSPPPPQPTTTSTPSVVMQGLKQGKALLDNGFIDASDYADLKAKAIASIAMSFEKSE